MNLRIATLLISAPALAQDVWVVDETGAADFVTPQEAVDAAAQRDTILIRAGEYPGFQVNNKSLQVVADTDADVELTSTVWVRDLPAQRDVYLSRLNGFFRFGRYDTGGHHGGVVLVESCDTTESAYASDDAVQLWNEMRAVCFVTCAIEGRSFDQLDCQSCPGGSALVQKPDATPTDVLAYHSSFRGGNGGDGWGLFCFNGGDGGHGFWMNDGLLFTHGGSASGGIAGDGCPAGDDGVDYLIRGTATHAPSTASANQLRVPDLAREQEVVEVKITGTPGHGVWLLDSDELQSRYAGPAVGDLVLRSPLGFTWLGTLPNSGSLVVPMTIADLPAGVESERRFYQAMFTTGSGRYLSNPSGMVVVDSAF